jgi:thymidylate synthase (FAD)
MTPYKPSPKKLTLTFKQMDPFNKNPWSIVNSSKSRLVSHTPDPEAVIAYIARVTSKDQENTKIEGLLKYCAKHGHWSVFEQGGMTVEVVTPLAIAVQLIRHSSFKFQQFSGRYEDQCLMKTHTGGLSAYLDMFYVPPTAREQDPENRQNSIVASDPERTKRMQDIMTSAYSYAIERYNELIDEGYAKEIARFVLPEGVFTRLYVKGDCRSWIHYLQVRDDEGVAQFEHVELARSIKPIFESVFPTVSRSIAWQRADLEAENKNLKEKIKELETVLSQ